MPTARQRLAFSSARLRLVLAATLGIIVGAVLSWPLTWQLSALLGWDTTAVALLLSLWLVVLPMDPDETASHAAREDDSRTAADLLIVAAAVASLLGVVLVILGGKQKGANQGLSVTVAVASVLLSWTLVHGNYALRYARLYYTGPDGGIDFKSEDKPKYSDFAYVSFTLGMTYQVADTDLQSSQMRTVVIRHALLSYVFGAVIIAATINLVAGLSN